MNRVIIIIAISISLFACYLVLNSILPFSCQDDLDDSVTEALISYSESYGIDYCKLLDESLMGDPNSLKAFSLLSFTPIDAYDHGTVLLEIIDRVGEEKYTEIVRSMSHESKQIVWKYIHIGFANTHHVCCIIYTIEKRLPKLCKELCN